MREKFMFKKQIFSIVSFLIFLSFFFDLEVARPETECRDTKTSFDIRKGVDDLKTGVYRSPDDEKRRKQIVKNTYSWIKQLFGNTSGEKAVNSAREIFPSISDHVNIPWEHRLRSRFEHKDKILRANKLSWETHQDDLLLVQIDYLSFLYRKKGYILSAPPQIYLKKNRSNNVISFDLTTWKYAGLNPTIYTIHGFAHHDGVVCPDVLVSAGPVGSGNHVYLVQMHYNKLAQCWEKVWEFGAGHVVNVEYPENNGELTITYLVDKWRGDKETVFFHLKWGGQPDR